MGLRSCTRFRLPCQPKPRQPGRLVPAEVPSGANRTLAATAVEAFTQASWYVVAALRIVNARMTTSPAQPERRSYRSGDSDQRLDRDVDGARSVRQICVAAGVPVVSAHGLRGTHATLATARGTTGEVVAAALGHESPSTTYQSYAKPSAVRSARQDRVLKVLKGGVPG
jgi:hypothetical protein